MTEDDLKHLQDNLLEDSKNALLKHGQIGPVGFVVTRHKRLDKLFASGYGVEFINPSACVHDAKDPTIVTLHIDLAMDWKKLYHAVLAVFPKTQSILPSLLLLGTKVRADNPYKRVMRPFLSSTQINEKDVIAALMRQICDRTDALACIFHSEAWQRYVEPGEEVPDDFGDDTRSIEVLISSMETYALARMITVPVHRATPQKKRDDGKVESFGDPIEVIDRSDNHNTLEGRLMRFLKQPQCN